MLKAKNSSYMKAIKPVDKTLSDNTTLLKNKFNFEVNEINKKLTSIYCTPTLHKNCIKARFTIAITKSSVKPQPVAITSALKLIHKQIENCNFKNRYYLFLCQDVLATSKQSKCH